MSGIKEPERHPEWFTCETCKERVFEIRSNSCKRCVVIAYLTFRHAVNWPLDEAAYKRLGLK